MDPRAAMSVGNPMAYEHLFVSGRPVDPRHFLLDSLFPCQWRVKMLTGPVPDMGGKIMRHRKMFHLDGDVVRGVNVVRDWTRWGCFVTSVGWGKDGRPATVLNYGVPENTFLTSSIVDHVRVTEDPDVVFGKYYLGETFGGYFSLVRDR